MKRVTAEEFFARAKEAHGDRYDYSISNYFQMEDKIAIICKSHGVFYQTPYSHSKGHGCPKCAIDNAANRYKRDPDEFISISKSIHGDKYDYSKVNYINCNTNVDILCSVHGLFSQKPQKHLNGQGCPLCGLDVMKTKNISRTKTTEWFIEKAIEVHGDNYSYEKSNYISANDKITITCPIHGDFKQRSIDHLDGSGCRLCNFSENNFLKKSWLHRSPNKLATFYIIKCFNENECFYKFGITINGVFVRYRQKNSMPYNYEIVRLVISSDREYVWNLEKRFEMFKAKNKYHPLIPFAGSRNECFSVYAEKTKQE